MCRSFSRIWLFSVVLLIASGLHAQENATITGTVTDPTDAVVPNAEITLTNQATGQTRKTVTDSSGLYFFPNVGVGRFTIEAMIQGFQKLTKTDLVVNTAQTGGLYRQIALRCQRLAAAQYHRQRAENTALQSTPFQWQMG